MLRHLLDRPGKLITKAEFLDAVWPDVAVSEGILNKSIGELRSALGDDRDNPRFIETVPRRGFRWIDPASALVVSEGSAAASTAAPLADDHPGNDLRPYVVGRDAELAMLERCFTRAAAGTRQMVFVTGEAGAGKSTVVEAFLARLHESSVAVQIAHGECIESYGQHEPYRPLLEALDRLARSPDHGASILATLGTHAPSWLRQIPSLGTSAAPVEPDAGMGPARMLRELAAALEAIAQDDVLVLVLEDMHWADLATVDACNLLARRRDRARLMTIVTLRAADALVAQHPVLVIKAELLNRGQATEIPIALFTRRFVQEYLRQRCSGFDLDPELVSWIHHQTAGNPLFVRILADDLILRGIVTVDEDGQWKLAGSPDQLRDFVPDSLRELVERQVDRLSTVDRDIVEAASVLPMEFAAASVAAVAGVPAELAEGTCEALARRGQVLRYAVRQRGGVPSRSGRFAFVHSMVQRILHDRLPLTRLRRLHLAAAQQLECDHAGREDSSALELALHYAMAGQPAPALAQLQRAAALIQSIPAPREVIVIREQILDLVERSPDISGHRRERIVATMELAQARQRAFALVDAQTTALCERVVELAISLEDASECFQASMGLFSNRFYTGRYVEAREIGRRLLLAARVFAHPFMTKSAHFAIAGAAYRLADIDEAQEHFEACLEHEAESKQTYGWDFHLMSMSHLALVAIYRGQHDQARNLVYRAEEHIQAMEAPPDASAMPLFGYALALIGDDEEAMIRVQRALTRTESAGAAAWIERARFVHGLLLSRRGPDQEGIGQMKASLARQARHNVLIDRSAYCALLAGEMIRHGIPGARTVLDEGIAYMERSGERHFEPELRRLRAGAS